MENKESELYPLIDRLQKCSEINYPNRPWNIQFYNQCAFLWKDKIQALKARVIKLESELNNHDKTKSN